MIKILSSIEEASSLKGAWNLMVGKNPHLRLFQSFDWNYRLWTEYYAKRFPDSRLFVLVATRDGHDDEKAILPLFVDGNKTLRFIGDQYADSLDMVSPAHTNNWHSLMKDIVEFLGKSDMFDSVSLEKMPGNSELLQYLGVYYKKDRAVLRRSTSISHVVVADPTDISTAFPQLNSKERSYLRSILKKNGKSEFIIYSKKNGDDYPKREITELRDWLVEHGERDSTALPDELIDIMGGLYDDGRCELAVCKIDGKWDLASYRLIDTDPQHVIFWVVLHRNPQLTTVADVNYILAKAKEGLRIFDFGTGAYSYKMGTFRPAVSNVYDFETRKPTWREFVRDVKDILRVYVKNRLKKGRQ